MNVEDTLLRAALLAHEGRNAQPLARQLASVAYSGGGRSCFDGGGTLQFTIDAPGETELQVGVRLGDKPDRGALAELIDAPRWSLLERVVSELPDAQHDSMGTWLHWRPKQQSLFFDLRDDDPRRARQRLDELLDAEQRARVEALRPPDSVAREWAAKIGCDSDGNTRVCIYWLLHRLASAEDLAETTWPGSWQQISEALGLLVRRPGRSGRWVITTVLDDSETPPLRLNNTAWLLVPENTKKQRAIGRLMDTYGGPRRYAESLWSLCRTTASDRWRVGRTCEVSVDADRIGARLYFSPQTSE